MAEDEFEKVVREGIGVEEREFVDPTTHPIPYTTGWVAPSEVIYADYEIAHPLEFPKVQTKRGGIYFPRYRVETMIQPAKKRFLRRQTWQLHVRYWDPAAHKNMNHYMVFASEHDARNAAEIIKFTIKNINDQVEAEKRAR